MDIDFAQKMAGKSDGELQTYLAQPERYVPEALNAVVAELNKRKINISDQEIQAVAKSIETTETQERELEKAEKKRPFGLGGAGAVGFTMAYMHRDNHALAISALIVGITSSAFFYYYNYKSKRAKAV